MAHFWNTSINESTVLGPMLVLNLLSDSQVYDFRELLPKQSPAWEKINKGGEERTHVIMSAAFTDTQVFDLLSDAISDRKIVKGLVFVSESKQTIQKLRDTISASGVTRNGLLTFIGAGKAFADISAGTSVESFK